MSWSRSARAASWTKVAKGFAELGKVGLLDEVPHVRISGAQAEGCSPVATAFAQGSDAIRPVKPKTSPSRWPSAIRPTVGMPSRRCVRRAGLCLGDRRRSGRCDRPVGPHRGDLRRDGGGRDDRLAGQAGRYGAIRRDERVVAMVTGHGLKTVEALSDYTGPTATIAPTLAAFDAVLEPHAH